MILVRNDEPVFYGFVNSVIEKKLENGSVITNYAIGTSEVKNKDTNEREYSSWFATLIGNARKKCDANPLKKGDRIAVTSFKLTNASKKMANGEYSKPYLKFVILDYVAQNSSNNNNETAPTEQNPF